MLDQISQGNAKQLDKMYLNLHDFLQFEFLKLKETYRDLKHGSLVGDYIVVARWQVAYNE